MKFTMQIAFLSSLLSLLLVACETKGPSKESGSIATELHKEILDRYPEFREIRRNKVLVGCIHWPQSSSDTFSLKRLYNYSESVGSDGPYPVNRAGTENDESLRLCLLPDETRVRLEYDDCIATDGILIAE